MPVKKSLWLEIFKFYSKKLNMSVNTPHVNYEVFMCLLFSVIIQNSVEEIPQTFCWGMRGDGYFRV